jgi:hypothetical protein
MTALCLVAGLSECSLQYGCCGYLVVSPIRYLTLMRVTGVREILLKDSGNQLTVSAATMQWVVAETRAIVYRISSIVQCINICHT